MADCLKLRGWGLAVTKAHRCKPNQHSHGNPYSEQPSAEVRAAAQDVFLFLGSGPDLGSLPLLMNNLLIKKESALAIGKCSSDYDLGRVPPSP